MLQAGYPENELGIDSLYHKEAVYYQPEPEYPDEAGASTPLSRVLDL